MTDIEDQLEKVKNIISKTIQEDELDIEKCNNAALELVEELVENNSMKEGEVAMTGWMLSQITVKGFVMGMPIVADQKGRRLVEDAVIETFEENVEAQEL